MEDWDRHVPARKYFLAYTAAVPLLERLLSLLPFHRLATVDFRPLAPAARARVEARLAQAARPAPPADLVAKLGRGDAAFNAAFERVQEEVKRRCADAEIWQNFYLSLLDEDGPTPIEGDGMGAQPVDPDEELRRLLAGVTAWPVVRSRFAWELGYHTLRYALLHGDAALVKEMAAAAAEDFLLAYDAAQETEAKVNALGDFAGAITLGGDEEMGRLLCDFAATTLSAEEATRQELHRLRKEGAPFVRESFGK